MHNALPVICFDLGGVVLRICRSWDEACARAGIDVRTVDGDNEHKVATRRELVVDYQRGVIDCTTFARSISETLGGIYTPDEVACVHRAWVCEEYPGVCELIDDLHAAGHRTACLSNTNHSHWELITLSRAVMRLQTRLASHHLGMHKPDEDIYREAERRLHATPQQIIFFDDTEENVVAAQECGWRAYHIDHAGDTAAQMRDFLATAAIALTPAR